MKSAKPIHREPKRSPQRKTALQIEKQAKAFEEQNKGRVKSLHEVYAEERAAGKVPVRLDNKTVIFKRVA